MIKLSNVELKYKDFKLGPINLKINKSEFISIVGASGSGKSSLIKVITSNNYTNGSVDFIKTTADDIMYISQIGTTFNHLTIRDNLCLKYKYTNEQISNALKQVGLSFEFIDKYPFELSGGERQRIDLVRALLSNSKWIILDESMSALDYHNKAEISKVLKDLVHTKEITVIYITHDVNQAIEYSTRIIALNKGSIQFDGTSQKFLLTREGEL